MSVAAHIAIGIIRLYQRTISPDHGLVRGFFPHGVCMYQPTCSYYMIRAIQKYGFTKGLSMGFRRILRCGPGGEPQVDEP